MTNNCSYFFVLALSAAAVASSLVALMSAVRIDRRAEGKLRQARALLFSASALASLMADHFRDLPASAGAGAEETNKNNEKEKPATKDASN